MNHLIKHLYNLYLWKQKKTKKKHKILLPLRGTQYSNNNESTLIQHDVESVLIHCCCVDSLCLPTETILLGLKKHPSPLFLSSLFVVPLSLLKQQGIKKCREQIQFKLCLSTLLYKSHCYRTFLKCLCSIE